MKLRLAYTLNFHSKPSLGLRIPLQFEIQEKAFRIDEFDETELRASAYVEGSVDTDSLSVKVGKEPLDGTEPMRGIEVLERRELSYFLSDMVNIVSFLLDAPIRVSHRIGFDQLIPETEEDRLKLESFGTSQVFQQTYVSLSTRSFSLSTIADDALETLYQRRVGIALYRQALLLQEPIGVFREFWKILESAFGAKGSQLIQLISSYQPATELGFTNQELQELQILRGRSSHAESRSGISEFQFVNQHVSKVLPRLKCLVEQVIVTKRTWGVPSLGTERLAEVSSYIKQDGTLVIINRTAKSSIDDHSRASSI